MLLGHFALALAAKRWTPAVSLGVLVFAAQWADLLWPLLVLTGIERLAIEPGATAFNPLDFVFYPWSHSLLALLVWGALIGGVHYAFRRRLVDALVVGALVPSHWLLDLVVHRPDLPLVPGGAGVGLGLWDSVVATLIIEFALLAVGAWLYLRATQPRDPVGRWGAYALVALLLVLFLGSAFGPAPETPTQVAAGALTLWLFVPLAWWVDQHREADAGG